MKNIYSFNLISFFVWILFFVISLSGKQGFSQDVYYVDSSANAPGTGMTWNTAFPSLQDALDIADAGDEVWVAEGTYYPDTNATTSNDVRDAAFELETGVELYGGFTGTENFRSDRNWQINVTILSGDIDQNDHTSEGIITDPDSIIGGNSYSVVRGNNTNATAILDGFTITGGNSNGSTIHARRYGGGMFNSDGSPTVANVVFIGNKAVFGGGMANLDVSLPAVTNVHFINNEATNQGGGMYNVEQSHATLTNVIFYSNYAQNNGGGMYNRTGSDPELMNVLFSENVAGNNAGAMLNRDSSSPTITNVTIVGNVSEAGKTAGIYNGNTSTATLNNVIIWGNFSGTNTDTIAASINTNNASNPTISHSLIAHSGGSSGWNMDIGTDGGNNRDAYPIFLDAGDIDGADDVLGTPDDGLTLYSTSPAVNSGVNGAIPSGVTTDLAGQDRIFDQAVNPDVVDMGAYELQDESQDPVQPDMNNIIYVDQNDFGGDQSGSSWSNAMPELRKALNWARNQWDGSNPPLQIWVADGTYLPASGGSPRTSSFRLVDHVEIYGGFDGGEMNIGDRDWMTNVTVLSGDIDKNDITDTNGIVIDAGNLVGPNSYHVVNGSGSDSTAVLDGFFITAGRANGSGNNNLGGGLYMNNSNPTLNRLHFMGNWARLGGGLLNDNGSNPTLTDVTFSGNHASSDGGGMYNLSNCSPTLINVSFYDNQAVTRGGGIRNVSNSNPTLINVVFKGNQAYYGGGMFNGNECDPILINATFSGNNANYIGGGMANEIDCHPVIINSIFWNNQADGVTNTFSASIANVSGSSPTFSWSMVDNCNPGGNWVGLCGNNAGNNLPDMDPLFIDGPNPADAPIDIGNLRLQTSSPVINAGDNTPFGIGGTAENVVIDLDGNARIFDGLPNPDTIDLGAYEVQEEPTDDEPLPLSPDMDNVMYVDIHVDTAAMGYTGTGDSWANAVQKLQDALTWAQDWDATMDGILQIWVADGVYFPDEGVLQADNDRDAFFQLVNGVEVYGGFDGIEANLMDRDWRTHVAILSGDIDGNDISTGGIISEPDSIAGDNSYTVVNGSNTNDSSKIDGFTITGGKSNSSSSYIRQLGGGFFNNDGSPTVANITLRGNIARFGGGMGNYNESDPSLTNVIFYKNFAEQNGGGLFNHTHSSPVIVNAIFAENEASMHAGAIHNRDESSPTLVNVTIVGNTAPTGGAGGIRNGTGSETIMENVIIWGNSSGGDPDIPLASMFSANPTGVNISNSLIDNSGGSTNWDSDLGVDGGGNLDEDPLFLNIIDPNGLDDIFATIDDGLTLMAGSPAIGFGANAPFEMGGVAEGVTTDLVGFDRIFGSTVDMGAYESPDATGICPGNIAYVDSSASGSNNGTTWDNAFTDLQDALEAARNCPDVDSIFVAKGTYYPTPDGMNRDSSFVIPDSTVIMGGFPTEGGTLAERDWNANLTVLSGDIDNNGDLNGNSFHLVTTVNVDSLTVFDGFTIAGGNADGSIFPDDAGGGWYNDGSNGGSSNPTISNTTFTNNSASLGAALYNNGTDGVSSPKLVNNIFLSNMATSSGGAIYNAGDEGESSPNIINCLFQENSATNGGGAIINYGGEGTGSNTGESSPLIVNCTFAGNSADIGGAMYNVSEGTSTACFPVIINSIFSENSATTAGPVFLNSISVGNLIISIRYSLFDVALADLNNEVQCPGCVDDVEGNKYSTDPDFVDALSGDFHLSDTSEAVDMGDPMTDLGVFLTDTLGMEIDLDGYSRVFDGQIDMGVYEFQNLAGICPVGIAYVDSTADGFNNGTSWDNAYTDLQDALEAVRNCPDVDTIFVAKGTYYPSPDDMNRDSSFVIPDSTVVLGGFPTGGGTLAERDWAMNKTILSADIGTSGDNSDNSYHIITTVNVDPLTMVDGFTITGGNADGSPNDKGSGWYNVGNGAGNSSNPTIRRCRFINNSADNGGAMYNDGSDGGESSPLLVNCIFSGNQANFGGALFNDGFDGGESSPELDNCILSGNQADLGGAIYNEGRGGVSSPLLVNCVLSGNQTDSDGGVMFNLGTSGVSSPVLVNCVLSGNRANGDGGVMYNYGAGGSSSPKVINSIFYNNDANDEGTVFYNIVASPVISYSMFDVTLADLNIGLVCTSCVNDVAGNKFSTDPQFIEAPMASAAPTTTGDFHPVDTSMAVNMGDPMTDLSVFLTDTLGTEIDLDGNPRLFDGTIDMGVYESQVKFLDCSDYPDGIVYVDSSANGINNGASWMDAFTDLQDALNVLRICPNADSIFVAKGTYYPSSDGLDRDSSFVIPDSGVVLGGFPSGGGTLTTRDWNVNWTILNGDIDGDGTLSGNSLHIVVTTDVDSTTLVDGFTITGGNAEGITFPGNLGGGWYNEASGNGSYPRIWNCVFTNNYAENEGGAMYNDGSSGESSPELVNCIFSGNAAGANGGAMYNDGSNGESSPELVNCIFSGNAAGANGGAIFNNVPFSGTSSTELVNCVFSGNSAVMSGGAVYNREILGDNSPVITNSIFNNNQAGSGSVFYNNPNVVLSVRNSLFDTTYAVLNTGCMACVDTSGGSNLYNTNPLFVDTPLASAAPTTLGDFHLQMCSPAINAGDNAANMEMEDLDGNARVFGDTIDMGAYEFQGPGGAAPKPVCPEDFFVCYSAPAISLTVDHPGQPAGGTYSGAGVLGDLFTAADAGTGIHEIIYTYTDVNGCSDTCHFMITVGEETVVTCPGDFSIAVNAAPVTLMGAIPPGGTFTGMGVSGTMFDPALATMGANEIMYSVLDDSSCLFSCTFTIMVTAAISADYTITTTNNDIIITDIAGNNDALVMSENGADVRFFATGRTYSVDGGPVQSFPADVALAGVDSIRILAAGGADVIDIEAFAANLPSLDINGGGGNDHVRFNGTITFMSNAHLTVNLQDDTATPGTDQITVTANTGILLSGSGNITFKVSGNIVLQSGSDVSSEDGNIVTEANRQTIPTSGHFQGVLIDGGTLQSTGGGNIYLYGRGGDDGSFNDNHGLVILGSGIVQTVDGTRIEILGEKGGGNSASILMNHMAQVNAQANTSHIIFQGDDIRLTGGSVSTSDSVTIKPFNEDGSWNIDLGSTADPLYDPLSVSDTELDLIDAGLLIIGSETTDSITISADIDRSAATNMEVISGSDILFSGGGIQTGGGTLVLHPGDTPAAVYPRFDGIDVDASALSFASDISIEINGTTLGDGSGTTYTQLDVMGNLDLTGMNSCLPGAIFPP